MEAFTIEKLGIKNYQILQPVHGFRFGTDAVLLADFPCPKNKDKVVDLGSGTGIIPILLCASADVHSVTAIEIDKEIVLLSSKSVALNELSNKINILHADIRHCTQHLPNKSFDLVTCNPPYTVAGAGLMNEKQEKSSARHELSCTLEDCIKAASLLLRFGGRLCMVHKPHRLADIICTMRKYNIEAKRLVIVHSSKKNEPSLILIEGRSGGKSGLRITFKER